MALSALENVDETELVKLHFAIGICIYQAFFDLVALCGVWLGALDPLRPLTLCALGVGLPLSLGFALPARLVDRRTLCAPSSGSLGAKLPARLLAPAAAFLVRFGAGVCPSSAMEASEAERVMR